MKKLMILASICLLLSSAFAQTKTLRDEVREKGYAKHGRMTDLPLFRPHTLEQLIEDSDIIVLGEVTGETTRLTQDETEVMTDYTILIKEIFKTSHQSVNVGDHVIVSKYGGNMLLDGKPVQYDSPDFPPIPHDVPAVFFVTRAPTANQFWQYGFTLDNIGVWRFHSGKLSCETSQKRQSGYTESLCGKTEDEVITYLKQKIVDGGATR